MKNLSEGKESRLIFQFAMPMLLGNVFQQLYNIVDSIIIGNYLGKEALAAVGASFPIMFILISLVIGFAIGSTIIIAQYFGAKDINNVKRTIDTLFIVLFFASIILSVIGISFSEDIFKLVGLPEDVLPQAKTYLNIYLSGLIFFFGFNGISAVLRGLGDSKTPLYFLIFSTIMNILLDLLFVIVFKWGIAGVSIATIISQGTVFIIAIIYLNKTHKIIKLSFLNLKYDKEIFYKSLKIGLPSGFQQTFVGLGMLALIWIVNMFGTNTIAAYTVAMRINLLATMPAMNFAAALSTFVGHNLGANKPERVYAGLKATLLMTSIISITVTAIAILFAKELMGLFTSDKDVIEIGVSYLIIVSSFYLIFSTMFIVNGVLRGAGDTLIPMFITLFALWIIRIPLSYFLSQKIGVTGIWWSIPIGWFVGMTCSFLYFLSGKWKTKTVVKYTEHNSVNIDN
ncbi:MAG: MATE family efflux transporter [Bacteroidales bacterium]|nr:MATE family efflux transporter [Bacteroidales bacterium]